ncbi:MAG TPA: YgjP-like metallopeptidase domain-containing protein [Chloroflexota bacterium]|nr:YgjP-like metallopeptidase domain-containing protein [Chloroflexota bacterium]
MIQPAARRRLDIAPLFVEHGRWVLRQLDRVARLRTAHPAAQRQPHQILLRGDAVTVSHPTARALEAWLKREARIAIDRELALITPLLGVTPRRVFLRSQRTMWGSCSTRGNVSFNWRCVMAPDHVLRYLVVHEAAHLLHPNHSPRYWEVVRRLHPDVESAKRWLTANGHHLMVDLDAVVAAARWAPQPPLPSPLPSP